MTEAGHASVSQRSRRIRRWQWVHRWSSLICTGFMLLLCLTGLPLIFSDEIEHWSAPIRVETAMSKTASVDDMATKSRAMYPNDVITSILLDRSNGQAFVTMAPSYRAMETSRSSIHFTRFDLSTATILEQSDRPKGVSTKIIGAIAALHENLLAGFAGAMLLAMMAALLLVALVSGVVLYGPFTRRLDFGDMRFERSKRIRWLDLHNLLGVATLAWVSVVGVTGMMNEFASPLFAVWERANLAETLARYRSSDQNGTTPSARLDTVIEAAAAALPHMAVKQVVPLGERSDPPHHYIVWTEGGTALTRQVLQPVLVDAQTAHVTAVFSAPWYLTALNISRPLHFGDYGGLPLKVIWALLDVVTICILCSGIYLWLGRGRREKAAAAELGLHRASPILEPAE